MLTEEEAARIRDRIKELQQEHQELDNHIANLAQDPNQDQLELQRLKKRKLLLKDTLNKLEAMLVPDIPA